LTTKLSARDKQNILALCDRFKKLYPAAVSDVMDHMGYENHIVYGGIKRMIAGREILCGPAATIRGTGAWGPHLPERTDADSSELKMTTLVRSLWPYILVEYGVLLIITYLPDAILWLPRLFGY